MDDCILCGMSLLDCPGHDEDWCEVHTIITDEAAPEVSARVLEIVKSGAAKWQWDPNVDGVAGLVKPGTDYAFMAVYGHLRDFETSLDFFGDDGL